ncbi:MAG TPA: Kazal-type serine protease inhibitor domain-containing protein, partial [Polyangiales bacterium]|nr:Kazal-type serine protease inhibitor domain-containing protein [Polyangiales bacterium]
SPAAGSGGKGGAGSSQAGQGGGPAAGSGGGRRCGTRGGMQCGANQFCNFEPDADCGGTDRGGVCETKSQVCPDIYEPVCGCDNRTYSSDCNAHSAGVSVKRDGLCNPDECEAAGGHTVTSNGATIPECKADETGWNISGGKEQVKCCLKTKVAGRTCGGIAALECDDKQFCNYEKEAGGQGCDGTIADAAGRCEPIPGGACTRDYRPVCSCERRTHSNACEAHAAGASIMHDGACTMKDCKAIGGRVAVGSGPPAKCNPNETEHGSVVGDDGSIPIEGALCCLP